MDIRFSVIAAAAILVLVSIGFAYGYSHTVNALDELSLSNVSLASLDFKHEPPPGFFVNVSISISNSLDREIQIDTITYSIYVNNTLIGKGSKKNVVIPPSSKAVIHIPLNVTSEDAVNSITESLQAGRMALHAKVGSSIPVCWYGVVKTYDMKRQLEASNVVRVCPLLGSATPSWIFNQPPTETQSEGQTTGQSTGQATGQMTGQTTGQSTGQASNQQSTEQPSGQTSQSG